MKHLKKYNENTSQSDRFFFTQDESSHWYMIPTSLKARWQELNYGDGFDDDDVDELVDKEFGQYRTGGGISNISFENPQKF